MNDQKIIEPIFSGVLYNAVRGIMGIPKVEVRRRLKDLLNTGNFYLEQELFTVVGGTNNKPGFLSLRDLQTGEELIRCTFKEGFCVDVTIHLHNEDQYDSFMDGIRAQGFKYSRFRRWELPGGNYLWRIEKNSPDEYLAVCRRLRPVKTVMTRIAA